MITERDLPIRQEHLHGGGAEPAAAGSPAPKSWRLPPTIVQILRACALQGAEVDAAAVAEMLGIATVDVLEALQLAIDAGLPVEDVGAMRVRFAPELLKDLERSTQGQQVAARRPADDDDDDCGCGWRSAGATVARARLGDWT